MDFTIRLRAEGTAETRAQAEAVKAVRTELEATIATAKAAGVAPKAVFDAAKAKQKKENSAGSGAEKEVANAEKKRAALEKSQAREESSREKATNRLIEQKKKQQEREDKEIERFASKAQKDLIKDEKDRQKKALQTQAEKIDPELKQLSVVEKAKKSAAKKADEAMAARIDPSVKKISETEKAKNKLFGKIGTGLLLAGGAAGAALAGIASKLAPLALGVMGMARIQIISAQAGFNMRRLFMGTNPRPLLDALQRTSQLIDPRTFTGQTLGEFLRRSADSTFAMLAKAEPYARLFFKGLLNGALQVENMWLKLRIAIQPALNMFPAGTGLMTSFAAGALTVKAAVGLMGVGLAVGMVKAGSAMVSFGASALAATGPLLPFAVAIVAWTSAIKGAIQIAKEWDENSLSNIGEGIKNTLGITSDDEYYQNVKGVAKAVSGDDYDKKYKLGKYAEKPVTPTPKGAEKQAATAGPPIGKNLGLGIVAGMKDTQAKVEAGGRDLVLAAEGGAKTAAEIKSPARKWRREIGRNLGEGAALGLEDSADRVEEAGRALVPSSPTAGGFVGRRGASIVVQQIGPFYGVGADVEAEIRRIVPDVLDDMAERMGALA
jgi:actin-related protein